MIDSCAQTDDIKKIVELYRDSILRLAFAYLKNHFEAEDIAQDVFVTYIKNTPDCENEAKRKAWLMQVTVNKCKNLLSSAWRKHTTVITEDLEYLPQVNTHVIEYVLALDEKYRIPIHLYYYDGYSIDEIAHILNAKPATVGTRLARGRKMLKDMIGDDFYD